MRYALDINEQTQQFIGETFNDGVIPEVEDPPTVMLFGNAQPNEIVLKSTLEDRVKWVCGIPLFSID